MRELDRRCAEALGWTVYHYDKAHRDHCYYMLVDAEFVPVNFIDGSRTTEADAWNDVPSFSEDISAAWTLIERCYSGRVGRLSNGDEYEAYLVIERNRVNADGFARARTPALAIVKAFLAAVASGGEGG